MRRNGMCPLCYLKKLFSRPSDVTDVFYDKKYENGAALTPPMGWSSWNTFRNQIDDKLLLETAQAMKDTGLVDAGYEYINLDDCWHSSMRDENGLLQGDLTRFPAGIPDLVEKLNALGLKVGIYSSNGTFTCEDLPASLGHEKTDAYTFAKWGVEYFKYDFCHNKKISKYAPLVFSISLAPAGGRDILTVGCEDALLFGTAKLMPDKRLPGGMYISGLDGASGKAVFKNVIVPKAGRYVLTINILKKGLYEKFLIAHVNGESYCRFEVPSQKPFNLSARYQAFVDLKEGGNTISLFNPVRTRADSAMVQYQYMGQALKEASARVAQEQGREEKPIVFSICEWGINKPWKWGASAGNLWRTTMDIRPWWKWMKMIYERNVKLYKYSQKGNWNDPDMLEVGNGKLTPQQNRSHFALWCMMCSPLILGNDLRKMKKEVLDIITNKKLIAIDQDELGVPAKRVKKGGADVLARPLSGGRWAVCFFNKSGAKEVSYPLEKLQADGYVKLVPAPSYAYEEVWSGKSGSVSGKLSAHVDKNDCKVFILTPQN